MRRQPAPVLPHPACGAEPILKRRELAIVTSRIAPHPLDAGRQRQDGGGEPAHIQFGRPAVDQRGADLKSRARSDNAQFNLDAELCDRILQPNAQSASGLNPLGGAGCEAVREVASASVRQESRRAEAAKPEQGENGQGNVLVQRKGRDRPSRPQADAGQNAIGQPRPKVAPQGRARPVRLEDDGKRFAVQHVVVRCHCGALSVRAAHMAAPAPRISNTPARRSTLRGSPPIHGP